MPTSVSFAFLVELALIVLTTLFLIQPKMLFPSGSGRIRTIARWTGLILLCITFCWSIVFGIVLSINEISLQF